MGTKKEIRTRLLKQRAELPLSVCERQSEEVLKKLLAHPAYAECRTLFSYVSFRNEVDTHKIIMLALAQGKQVAVPRVEGKDMIFYRIFSLEELTRSRFGILEPKDGAHRVIPGEGDLMLVPAAAFDGKGYRIGYGGGYYDRYLAEYPQLYTIGLAFDFQMLDEVPREEFDLAVKEVLYPDGRILT